MTKWVAQYFHDGDEEPFFTGTIEAETHDEAVHKAWAPVVENVPVGEMEGTTDTASRTGIASRVRVLAQISGDIAQYVPPALRSDNSVITSNE